MTILQIYEYKEYLVIEVNDYDLIIKDIDLSKMLNKIIFSLRFRLR